MREALVPKLPASQRVELQQRLQAALDAENYELAAILRDELRMMSD
jgi:protein-arginine kinase activator protein McsA